MMDTRDRLTEVGQSINKGVAINDNVLVENYVTKEELWGLHFMQRLCRGLSYCYRSFIYHYGYATLSRYGTVAAPTELNNMMTQCRKQRSSLAI
jgi:hypothetical protein